MATGQRLQVVRQLIGARHFGAVDENRDHRNLPAKGGSNFNPYEVVGILESRANPARADDGKQNPALLDLLVKVLDKIDTERDIVDVLEDALVAKLTRKAVVDPPDNRVTVMSSIA